MAEYINQVSTVAIGRPYLRFENGAWVHIDTEQTLDDKEEMLHFGLLIDSLNIKLFKGE